MTTETWISVDVETSGPTPATGSLIAIGACLVERPEEAIELLLRPDPALPWSDEAETIHHLDREFLQRVGLEPPEALEALAAWLERAVPSGSRPIFVALNAPFDWMFVADCLWRHLGRNPFGISALDLKSLYMGRQAVARWEETRKAHVERRLGLRFEHTHHALEDARDQARLAQMLLQRPLKKPE